MIIKNSQQDIVIDTTKKRIGVKISGGADSAIVMYMVSKYVAEELPEATIIPITVNHKGKAYQEIFAKQVVNFCKEEFGDIFGQHQISMNNTPEEYISEQQRLVKSLYKNREIYCHFVGITKNPPNEIYSKWEKAGPSDDRDAGVTRDTIRDDNKIFLPLININKKGVCELYEQFSLLDTLFPLTRSCEIFTEDFSKHCETECWFCQERYWGFGRYV